MALQENGMVVCDLCGDLFEPNEGLETVSGWECWECHGPIEPVEQEASGG